jgi:enoyl-CoA hydratase
MSDEVLLETVDGSVLVITINRPQVRNAVNEAVAVGIAEALVLLDADSSLSVGIITGADGNFCAGMDLVAYVQGSRPIVEGRGFAGIVHKSCEKPLIAAVEGYALAGGFEIALACDLVVAARGARFGLPEVTKGLVAAAGGLLRLPRRIPYHHAMEIALLGEHIGAQRLDDLGLVNRLVDDGEALLKARELARTISAAAPLAVRATKAIVATSSTWSTEEQFARQAEIVAPVFASADAREGTLAFTEKRPPKWTAS